MMGHILERWDIKDFTPENDHAKNCVAGVLRVASMLVDQDCEEAKSSSDDALLNMLDHLRKQNADLIRRLNATSRVAKMAFNNAFSNTHEFDSALKNANESQISE